MFVYAHTSSGKSRDLGAWASALLSIILPSRAYSQNWHFYQSSSNGMCCNNTNTMVTMSREPIEKSCSSKQFQYSQETIETLQNIMREVASKMERPNVSIKRRKLTGWNIFTKRKSLESMLRREFVDDNEFIGYVIDNEEFKYRVKKNVVEIE